MHWTLAKLPSVKLTKSYRLIQRDNHQWSPTNKCHQQDVILSSKEKVWATGPDLAFFLL